MGRNKTVNWEEQAVLAMREIGICRLLKLIASELSEKASEVEGAAMSLEDLADKLSGDTSEDR